MDLSNLKKEDIIKIGNSRFQVVEDWDKDFIGSPDIEENWFRIFGLIDLAKGKMTISHWLQWFYKKDKVFLKNDLSKTKTKIKKEMIKISPLR